MQQRVRIPYRGYRSFVRQTTPHYGGTSRRASYSVAPIIHEQAKKVNTFFENIKKNLSIFND